MGVAAAIRTVGKKSHTFQHRSREDRRNLLLLLLLCGLTDVDELDAVVLDGVEGDGDVLNLVVLALRAPVGAPQPAPLEPLHQRGQPHAVAEVLAEVLHALAGLLQSLVHPVAEGVGLL